MHYYDPLDEVVQFNRWGFRFRLAMGFVSASGVYQILGMLLPFSFPTLAQGSVEMVAQAVTLGAFCWYLDWSEYYYRRMPAYAVLWWEEIIRHLKETNDTRIRVLVSHRLSTERNPR